MNSHRYILQPYKGMNTRYRCPSCNKGKTFSRYIDKETGEHLAPDVGRCNRESNCGYHYTPKQYFQDNNISFDTPLPKLYTKPKPKPVSFIPVEVFKQSLRNYESNNFAKFLLGLFGVEIASKIISRYFIATSKYWDGATVFWQIDSLGKIRTGKIMLYNPVTGKRVKEPFNHITWIHKAIKQPEFELKQCLFGEHLLRAELLKPVAIVESEKTAIIAGIYLPQFVWLATGSLINLSAGKCQALKGRNVILFPDLNGFEKWINKAKELSHLARFTVSDLLERKATEAERKQGLDLADYLIKQDYRKFKPQPTEAIQEQNKVEKLPTKINPEQKRTPKSEKGEKREPLTKHFFSNPEPLCTIEFKEQPESWEQDITELEQFFKTVTLPNNPVRLSKCEVITDINKFIDSHIEVCKAQNGKPTYKSYFDRLVALKEILTVNPN
ncbi:MAG: hypothetical protein GH151_02450 [Bacteroidetes bacterium]|nr:hypothetical protein [Bacteroidota bacterium]